MKLKIKRCKLERYLTIILIILGFAIVSLLILKNRQQTETSSTEVQEQLQEAITDNKNKVEILLCTTSIDPKFKTQAEVDKCYPDGGQAEYFKSLNGGKL
jgi:hypothetical protein